MFVTLFHVFADYSCNVVVERLQSAELLRHARTKDLTNSVQDEPATENAIDPHLSHVDDYADDAFEEIIAPDSPAESMNIHHIPEIPENTNEAQRSNLRKRKPTTLTTSFKCPTETSSSAGDSSDSDEESEDEATDGDESEVELVVKKRRQVEHEKKSPGENKPRRENKLPTGRKRASQVCRSSVEMTFDDDMIMDFCCRKSGEEIQMDTICSHRTQ